MKTKLALALAACTLSAQAITINITHHDLNTIVFNVSNLDVTGWDYAGQNYGAYPWQSVVDISVLGLPNNIYTVNVSWVAPSYVVNDMFTVEPSDVTFPAFEGSSYQLLSSHDWEWTYVNPYAPTPEQLPDNGSVLAGLGVALVGLWRIKR